MNRYEQFKARALRSPRVRRAYEDGLEDLRIAVSMRGNIEELEDRYLAEARLEKRRPSLTSRQVRKELGLDQTAKVKFRNPAR